MTTPEEWEEMAKHLDATEDVPALMPTPIKSGRICDFSVLCVMSGKGQENTASMFTLTLERAKPQWIPLVGIAGVSQSIKFDTDR